MSTAKKRMDKRVSARRRGPKPHWSDVLTKAAEVVLDRILGPERERGMTITAYADAAPQGEPIGALHLPLAESVNWSMDALAKFPGATRFVVTGRNGFSTENFDVRNGRVYEVPTLNDMRFDDNRPQT
jgi:hypothetical protein